MTIRRSTAAVVAAIAAASVGHAAGYSGEYVFGDSLSDIGNAAEGLGANFPNPPSYGDSFTNGPVAVQRLAGNLGLPALTPSLWLTGFSDIHGLFGPGYVPGTDYAVGGATAAASAVGGIPAINLPRQVAAYSAVSGLVADPKALYVVMIGGNDVREAVLKGTGAAALAAGVTTELATLEALANEGAANLLVVNVPNVGISPEFNQENPSLAGLATQYSQQYDSALAMGLAALTLPTGTKLTDFDLYDFNAGVIANAAAEGITDVTDPCYTATPYTAASTTACGPNGANIGAFAFWDDIHPTATIHALWSDGFAADLAAVPEPNVWAMMILGLAGLGAAVRRRRATCAIGAVER